jgi:hypothetical protein
LARGPHEQAAGPRRAKRFGTVVKPQQAERALCAWAELSFSPEAVEKLKIPFLFFHSVSN